MSNPTLCHKVDDPKTGEPDVSNFHYPSDAAPTMAYAADDPGIPLVPSLASALSLLQWDGPYSNMAA